jgi:hypothetical protein
MVHQASRESLNSHRFGAKECEKGKKNVPTAALRTAAPFHLFRFKNILKTTFPKEVWDQPRFRDKWQRIVPAKYSFSLAA